MSKKLNLGAQVHYFPGWINQDVVSDDPNIKVEIAGDAAKLPIGDNEIDFIYAGHLIEHYYPDTVDAAIKEWHRVLAPGGKLVIVTPDCGSCFKRYAAGILKIEDLYQQVYGRIYSYDGAPERHHIIFDDKNLEQIVLFAGGTQRLFSGYEKMNFNLPPDELKPFMDSHISRSDLQLGIIATK